MKDYGTEVSHWDLKLVIGRICSTPVIDSEYSLWDLEPQSSVSAEAVFKAMDLPVGI